MSDWTAGYVADIGYTYGYYAELNPRRTRLAFLNAGYAPPADGPACDLGFGQGVSINLHAASARSGWFGTDFNPEQAGYAQRTAAAGCTGAVLADQSFAEFCSREDLPDFAFIGLHGIWTWVNQENWTILIDFIRRKLRVDGVLYISYNTHPGWSAFAPLRDLMLLHKDTMTVPGEPILKRLGASLDFANKMMAQEPIYARNNPAVVARLSELAQKDFHYLAHEYFNRNWTPTTFAQMTELLGPAKIGFACSASYADHVVAVNMTEAQAEFVQGIPDLALRETTRDFMVNQQFRKDYWVKGGRKLSVAERIAMLKAERVVMVVPRKSAELTVQCGRGKVSLLPSVYEPILDAMAGYEPRSLEEIATAVEPLGISLAQVLEAAMLLMANNVFSCVQDPAETVAVTEKVRRMNASLAEQAVHDASNFFLASSVTGGGVVVPRFQQLFLRARAAGMRAPSEWVEQVLAILKSQGQKLLHEGRALETDEEAHREMLAQAVNFDEQQLPMLVKLGVAW